MNIGKAQCERKEKHDVRAVVRSFSDGDKVLTRVPGLRSKLEGSWEGPFIVLDAPSDHVCGSGHARQSMWMCSGKESACECL